jgi:hypothetical protein
VVLLLEIGDLIHGVTECGDCDVVLSLVTGDLIHGAIDGVWRL